jgi:hypothetical protein
MVREITLDDFWAGAPDLANLAAQILTTRETRRDSVWRGDPYGSTVTELLQRPGAEELVRRELERVVEVVEVEARVERVELQRALVAALDAEISISPHAVRR